MFISKGKVKIFIFIFAIQIRNNNFLWHNHIEVTTKWKSKWNIYSKILSQIVLWDIHPIFLILFVLIKRCCVKRRYDSFKDFQRIITNLIINIDEWIIFRTTRNYHMGLKMFGGDVSEHMIWNVSSKFNNILFNSGFFIFLYMRRY